MVLSEPFIKRPKKPAMIEDAKAIFLKGVEAVYPDRIIKSRVILENTFLKVEDSVFRLNEFKKIIVIGAGKASAAMAKALEDILGARISDGLIIVKYGHGEKLRHIRVKEANHPLPDENGLRAAEEIIRIIADTDEETLVIGLFSGGGSALLSLPVSDITLEEKIATTEALLKCGASIEEINTIRKHLSQVKGGRLMEKAYPSPFLALILSDVVGDKLDVIASGPTVADPTTFGDCLKIIEKYSLQNQIPSTVIRFLEKGKLGINPETPKTGDKIFEKAYNHIIGNNFLALKAAKKEARKRGYNTLILSSLIEGDTGECARFHSAIAREIVRSGNPISRPACILSGGETTVVVKGNGKGGRNQEFALVAALEISGLDSVCILSGGTDGTDGPTDAAGAFVNGDTVSRGLSLNMDATAYLENNDSYNYFKKLGDLIITGPTKTNVMDLRIILVK